MCNSEATSREHAPPSCFFPEEKSIKQNLRRNLITVPSCDLHNSKKSKDDEFFRSIVLMSVAHISKTGHFQYHDKFLRGVRRKPHVFNAFFEHMGTYNQNEGQVLRVDRERFDKCIENLSRAIFFHTFERQWILPMGVVSPNFYESDRNYNIIPNETSENAIQITRDLLGKETIRGDNPEVFKYRLQYDETDEAYAFAALFYECFEIFTFSSKAMAKAAV
jgi:hypothetical protein